MPHRQHARFSALQRAEIAEICRLPSTILCRISFSALQRAEIAEIESPLKTTHYRLIGFSALQRAEIAEIFVRIRIFGNPPTVSVLFNEPKLLKYQRPCYPHPSDDAFQCSSTSRNC